MKTRTRMLALAVVLAIAGSACGESVKKEIARDKKVDADMAAVVATGIPGVSIVVHDGGSTSRIALGVGDTSKRTPLRADDRFRIGSLAKTYVSTIVLQLVDEKKLGLDDPIERWVPGLVPNGGQITVKQLLNHTSGIANYEEHPRYLSKYLVPRFTGGVSVDVSPKELVAMGTEKGPLFKPGTASTYSNTNYTLAGLIIEKVTGSSLAKQLDERITRPLDLKATELPNSHEITGRHAHGYYASDKPPATDVTTFSPSIGWAGGSIISNTDDVTTFYGALLGGRLLPPRLLKEMMTTVKNTEGRHYGLGLDRRTLRCGTVWGHGGNFPGYLMESYSEAGGKHQVTVAYNLDPTTMTQPAKDAVNRLLTDAFCG